MGDGAWLSAIGALFEEQAKIMVNNPAKKTFLTLIACLIPTLLNRPYHARNG